MSQECQNSWAQRHLLHVPGDKLALLLKIQDCNLLVEVINKANTKEMKSSIQNLEWIQSLKDFCLFERFLYDYSDKDIQTKSLGICII